MEKNNIKPVVKANAVAELLSKGVIKKQTFDTKYKVGGFLGSFGKNKQKERLYFMGSVYPDTKVLNGHYTEKGRLIKKPIKHLSYGREASVATNFATLFNFDENNNAVIQQPYNGAPSIFGIMYKDYDTLFYGKNDSFGESKVGDVMRRKEESKGRYVNEYNDKVYFGRDLNKENDYLQRFDNYEQRIRKAIALTKEKLKINDIFNESKQEVIKKELLDNFNLQYKNKKNDDDFCRVDIDKTNKILKIGTKKGFYCKFSVEKDAILEKSGINLCNEFVSIKDAEVSSAFFFCDKNSLEDFFRRDKDNNNMSSFKVKGYYALQQARQHAEYEKLKFDDDMFRDNFYKNYDQNFRNLLNCQKQLCLPYIPILYKNDKLGFRLENMKLSVFAKKINDCFIKNSKKPLFSEAEIQEFEKFESEFDFENTQQEDEDIQKEEQQDDNGKNTTNNNILNNEIDSKIGKTADQKIKTRSAEAGQGQSLWDRLKSKCCCCFGGNENEIINTVNVNPSQLAIENKI